MVEGTMRISSMNKQTLLISTALIIQLGITPLSAHGTYAPLSAGASVRTGQQRPVTQGPTSITFQETGKTLRRRFLEYWQQNGALVRHGFPISDELQERSDTDGKSYTVQYFERSVFELHPQNPAPYDVLLQLLGVFRYKEMYRSNAPRQKASIEPGAQRFAQTGKTVGGRFLEYWKNNGGLTQFGYPLSEEFLENSPLDDKAYTVQYFERAVFELHPQNQPPLDVMLSQVGTFRWRTRPVDPSLIAPEFRTDIPDGEYIPVYPGSVLKRNFVELGFQNVLFEVPADAVRVRAWYAYTLPKYGWVFQRSGFGEKYRWTDPRGVVPWYLQLEVSTSGTLGSGRATVIMFYHRWTEAGPTP
jgi:hypothetical protein